VPLRALLCEITGLKPEAKYFLVRFIQCFGVTDPVDLGVKDLAKQIGVTDRQVSTALDALVDAAILIRSLIPNERGRPARRHRVAKTFLSQINRLPVPLGVMHEVVIERLMVHAGHVADQGEERGESLAELRARRKRGVLNRVNRLLLAVLLCGADRFGVVRNLGTVQICKATGLTKEMLRNRLKTLMDQALIRSYIPGLSSPVLTVKRKSVYYLNLNHEQMVGNGQATSILGISGAGKDHLGLDLLLGIRSAVNRDKNEYAEKAPILKVLAGQGRSFYRTFQALLEEYATQLLSRHWMNLKDRVDDLQLRQQILKDFRLPADLQGTDEIHAGDIRTRFNDQLFNFAYDMALWFKSLLSSASDVPLSDLEFVIVPQPATPGHLYRAFLALPKADQCWSGYLMIDTRGAKASIRSFVGEQEMPQEELYVYGLRSRPDNGEVNK